MRLHYPASLPISARRDEIVAAIAGHQCLILVGDTGSGKTTQLPKMCVEAGRGQNGMIACTQPRRIAALSVAERVAEETGTPELIGCTIRFHDQSSERTRSQRSSMVSRSEMASWGTIHASTSRRLVAVGPSSPKDWSCQ